MAKIAPTTWLGFACVPHQHPKKYRTFETTILAKLRIAGCGALSLKVANLGSSLPPKEMKFKSFHSKTHKFCLKALSLLYPYPSLPAGFASNPRAQSNAGEQYFVQGQVVHPTSAHLAAPVT